MIKTISTLLSVIALGVVIAYAQTFTLPPPPGVVMLGCVYNSSPPTLSSTNTAFVQCNSQGQLATSTGGGGLSVTDAAAWTAGVSQFTPSGGVFNDSATALTSGQQGTFRLTNNRSLRVLDDNSAALLTAAQAGTTATGTAATASAVQMGVVRGGATGGFIQIPINCDNHVFKHITSATDTLAVQGVTSQTIYICGWRSRAAGTATWYLENTASTNANCSSSNTQITGVASEVANSGEVAYNPVWGGLKNTVSNGLCINSTGTGGVDVDIWYAQF